MGVVDEEEQRPLRLGFRQEPEGREPDQERIRRLGRRSG
jgi:hypothetical protein